MHECAIILNKIFIFFLLEFNANICADDIYIFIFNFQVHIDSPLKKTHQYLHCLMIIINWKMHKQISICFPFPISVIIKIKNNKNIIESLLFNFFFEIILSNRNNICFWRFIFAW